jgi:hypothetical protein
MSFGCSQHNGLPRKAIDLTFANSQAEPKVKETNKV